MILRFFNAGGHGVPPLQSLPTPLVLFVLSKLERTRPQMKPLLILSLFAIASVISIAQKSTTPKETLYDFRANNKTTPIKIPPATQKMVLSKVFRKYLSDSAKCNPQFEASGSDNYLAAARKAGQIAPSIIDSTTGSFTAAGQTQTAYLISVSECGASHADNFGSDRVAIFAGQQLVADLDVDFRSSFARKTDLNVDGIDELLMTSGYMNQGTLTEGAALITFQGGRLNVIQDFETVTEDSCGSGFPGSAAKASVISYGTVPLGKMPKLQQDNYASTCRNVKRWRFISSGKMPE